MTAELQGCPETIRIDQRKIRQILYNLISNALKFTPNDGAVMLSVRRLHRSELGWVTEDGAIIPVPPATVNR